MGHYDEDALEAALSGQASYVGLVASPKRGRAVIDYLRAKGFSTETLDGVKYPAGLDIGAKTPEEVALSILTEIVQRMRAAGEGVSLKPETQAVEAEAIDPICNMTVDVADARYLSTHNGSTFYFCCPSCKQRFDRGAPPLHPPGSYVGLQARSYCTASTSARMARAISDGVRDPMSRPMGDRMRARSVSLKPCRLSSPFLALWVTRLPSAPI